MSRVIAHVPISRKPATILVALLAVPPLATRAAAQMNTGTIFGTVSDQQGAVIPGATVVLTSEARGTRSAPVVTNATGDYVIPNLEPDTYTLEVSMSGFKTAKRPRVPVSPGDRVAMPAITLEVGGASETVTVTAVRALIQAQSGERSFSVIPEEVENLPIFDRTFSALAALAPGMSDLVGGGGLPERLGAGGTSNAMFDGIGILDSGGNNLQLNMNMAAVREVKVMTSSYQAEFGRNSGVQISAVTKSGSNQFRGSIYDVKRNSDWNANTWRNNADGVKKPIVRRDDWGYTIGGPVGKPSGQNKLFFFYNQEWRPRTTGGEVARYRVPTAAERAGDFSQSRDNNGNLIRFIKDPLINGACNATSQTACFADGGVLGKIPADRLYPLGLNILNMWPLPNDESGYAATNSYNYSAAAPTVSSHVRQDAIRGDYEVSPRLHVSSRLLLQNNTKEPNNADIRWGADFARNNTPALIPGFNDMVDWVPLMMQWSETADFTLSPSTFVEASWGGFYNRTLTTPIDPASNKNNIGLGNFPMLFPDANIIDPRFYTYQILTSLGSNAPPYFVNGRALVPPLFQWGFRIANAPPNINDFGCCININRVQNVNLSVTKVMGSHTAKVGFYLDHSYKAQSAGVGATGSYRGTVNFANDANNPLDTGFGFANAALGVFSSYQQSSTYLEGNYFYNSLEWYLQDNWKVTPKLTLDYGLRFVHQAPQYDTYGFSSQFFDKLWDPAKAPALFQPVCVGASPCSGLSVRAQNPVTGEILGPGSSALVGQIVPSSGSLTNGVYPAGVAPNVRENYNWPWLVLAPRFGYAWSVRPGIVLRGGMGLFYDRPEGNSIFGQITNPPASRNVTVNYATLQQLQNGLQAAAPPALTVFPFNAAIPSSTQWNTGVQIALPWYSSLDVSYVGQHGYNLLIGGFPPGVDINAPDFGAAYLPENRNPTVATGTTPGTGALPVNFYRPFRGYGAITRDMTAGYNNFHSLQTSFNRRFSRGTSFTFNYTFSRNVGTAGNGARITRDANGNVVLRSDQDQANYQITSNDRTHFIKASFVWNLPGLRPAGAVTSAVATLIDDWRLSGIFTGGSGAPYTINYQYTNGVNATNLTGTPNYNARILIVGNPGSGCTSDPTRQFNTAAFAGPQPGSLGLESGLNYMRGCPNHTLDLAIARDVKVGGGNRRLELRAELYNVFNSVIYSARNNTLQMANLASSTVGVNLPYDANGNVIDPRRLTPRNAGFGVVTGARDPRVVQLTFRFSF